MDRSTTNTCDDRSLNDHDQTAIITKHIGVRMLSPSIMQLNESSWDPLGISINSHVSRFAIDHGKHYNFASATLQSRSITH